jgi:hypothetical protein
VVNEAVDHGGGDEGGGLERLKLEALGERPERLGPPRKAR